MIQANAWKHENGQLQRSASTASTRELVQQARASRPTRGATWSTSATSLKIAAVHPASQFRLVDVVTGASFGGYHCVNFAMRHPDLVTRCVSMSRAFDIRGSSTDTLMTMCTSTIPSTICGI